eukprot:3368527-Pyramimonas_sp.AAC.1
MANNITSSTSPELGALLWAGIACIQEDGEHEIVIIGDNTAALGAAAGTSRIRSCRNRPLARFTRILFQQLQLTKVISFEHAHAHRDAPWNEAADILSKYAALQPAPPPPAEELVGI